MIPDPVAQPLRLSHVVRGVQDRHAVTAAAFAVSWLLANRLRFGRSLYIGVLFAVTGASSAGYVAWLGLGAGEVLTTRWGSGLLAAPLFAAFPAFGMTRLSASTRRSGGRCGRRSCGRA